MATKILIRSSAAAALLLAASLALDVRTAPAQPAGTTLRVTRTLAHLPEQPAAYDWPVEPFDRQHPVRGFLDDPRIGAHGSHAFHFGIDISAPDGTPVYAVEAGEVFFDSGRAIAVVASPSHEFGYWHIVPVVKSHQHVARHQLLGYVDTGWEHVHFAERLNGVYLNPLRPGGLGPYADVTAPDVASISVRPLPGGGFQVLASAYDTPSPRVPGDWADEPVTPALLRWRVLRDGRPDSDWTTAADFRSRMLDAKLFPSIYTPATRQNHKGEPGFFSFYLAQEWKPADGSYRLEVQALDTRGNEADARLDVSIADGELQG
ncbi:MAG TPA: M23 family metallopeptidase [Gaiellaceae bacterium]|nr:M23 family metallopeptidase [Gaiellaceae bacterium]